MKRSKINHLIRESIFFFDQMNFKLPPWGHWAPGEWKGKYETCSEIVDNMLGWDLTDFGSGDFYQGIYHRFYGESGKGKVFVGEVSAVNDDTSDNRFLEPVGRFPKIEEDEAPIHLLASDYKNFI